MITIREPTVGDAAQISRMLCEDEILRTDLDLDPSFQPDSNDVLKDLRNWCKSRNAITFAVVLNSTTTVGTISLSHISNEDKTARIGYWIGGNHRSQGYCSTAFRLVVVKAKELGITKLLSTIAIDNLNSRAIWEKHGGYVAGNCEGKAAYELVCSHSHSSR